MARRRDLALAVGAAVVVVAVLVLGFRVLGPPRDQRAISADERRVSDLRMIAQILQARQKPQLPATLAELAPGPLLHLRDPLTNTSYEYHPKTGTSYELCAMFETASAEGDSEFQQPSPFWRHLKGRQCFELDASKDVPW
jgi:hypothetical protein